MADRQVLLIGFEGAVAEAIAARFRFSGPTLRNIPLVPGRHLFVQDLPSTKDIEATSAGLNPPFDQAVEPAIVLYTATGPKAISSVSSGGRHEFPIEIVMRLPDANEDTKKLLEELVTFIEGDFAGLEAGGFLIKRALITAAPAVIGRQENDQVLVSSTMRFFAVPMPK
jgi:hypothetical protein